MSEWTDAKNDRRCELIDKDLDRKTTHEETVELLGLAIEFNAHRRKVAPRPIAEVTAPHNILKAKASDWTIEKDRRRWELIEKDNEADLSESEQVELQDLHREFARATTLVGQIGNPKQPPKRPLQSKLFKTGLTMLLVGLFEVIRAIVVEHSWPGAAEITAAVGGALTIVFRRFTDRPMNFTTKGQRDGGSKWRP